MSEFEQWSDQCGTAVARANNPVPRAAQISLGPGGILSQYFVANRDSGLGGVLVSEVLVSGIKDGSSVRTREFDHYSMSPPNRENYLHSEYGRVTVGASIPLFPRDFGKINAMKNFERAGAASAGAPGQCH